MTDSLVNTLSLILSIIALFELIRNNVINCLALLGISGAVFIGMALKNHDGKSLNVLLCLFVAYIIIFTINYNEKDESFKN